MTEDKVLFGWDIDQWAIACGRYDINDAICLKTKWEIDNHYEPGEIEIIGVPPVKDYSAATEIVTSFWIGTSKGGLDD